jgi:hypothetical protein
MRFSFTAASDASKKSRLITGRFVGKKHIKDMRFYICYSHFFFKKKKNVMIKLFKNLEV